MGYAADYLTPGFVSTLAHALLATAATALGGAAPANQYVSMGQPAADGCDQLVVWVGSFMTLRPKSGTGYNQDRSGMEPQGALPAIELTVQLLRCGAPQADGQVLPSASVIDAHATSALGDGWALYRGLIAAYADGTLFGSPNPIPAHHTLIEEMKPYGPEGGVSGWTVPLRVSLF